MKETKNLIILRNSNDLELHVNEVRKRRTQIKVGERSYNSSDFDDFSLENDFFCNQRKA